MYKILNNWWGWLLCIIIARLVFSFFGEPVTSPEEQTVKVLVANLQSSSQQSSHSLAQNILAESVFALPDYRDFIVAELKKASENPSPYQQELATFTKSIEENPLFRLHLAVEKPAFPIIFYIEPLLIAIPFLWCIFFLLVMPAFLEYVVGPRSTIKLYGRKGKKVAHLFLTLSWCSIFYCCFEEYYLYAHIIIASVSFLFLFLLIQRKLLTLLLNIRQSFCWLILFFFIIFTAVSFVPYFSSLFISSTEEIKISQDNVYEAITSLEVKDYPRAIPLLKQIIQSQFFQNEKIICASLKIIGTTKDREVLIIVTPYLNHRSDVVQKQAMETILEIIKKEK